MPCSARNETSVLDSGPAYYHHPEEEIPSPLWKIHRAHHLTVHPAYLNSFSAVHPVESSTQLD